MRVVGMNKLQSRTQFMSKNSQQNMCLPHLKPSLFQKQSRSKGLVLTLCGFLLTCLFTASFLRIRSRSKEAKFDIGTSISSGKPTYKTRILYREGGFRAPSFRVSPTNRQLSQQTLASRTSQFQQQQFKPSTDAAGSGTLG